MTNILPARRRDAEGLATLWPRADLSRLFDNFGFDWPFGSHTRGDALPAMSISENGEGYVVKAEIPGINPKDVDITLDGEVLTLKGTKKSDLEDKWTHHLNERAFGEFVRSVTMPASCNPDKVRADYSNGVLSIFVAKREDARRRQVKVEVR